MKLEKYFLLLALGVFAFALQSCDDDDNDGISVPAELSNALAKEHPNAHIVDIEKEKNGMTEVEIVHGSISKDVMFTAEGAWAYTIWDISKRHLEDVVKNAVTAAHPGYVIDDADFIETPDGSYFLVEMEQGEREIYVKVTAEGEILP